MPLEQIESISVILASWFGILFALYQLVQSRTSPSHTVIEAYAARKSLVKQCNIVVYMKWIRFYTLTILFFFFVLTNIAINNNAPTVLDVISISACTGVIIFMLTGCAYKYILWKTLRSFESNIEL